MSYLTIVILLFEYCFVIVIDGIHFIHSLFCILSCISVQLRSDNYYYSVEETFDLCRKV